MSFNVDNYGAAQLLAIFAAKGGYQGITPSKDGTTATQLDIAIAAGTAGTQCYVMLLDGTVFLRPSLLAAQAAFTSPAITTGTKYLWISDDGTNTGVAVFAVNSSATVGPTAASLNLATITTSASTINAVTAATAGISL